MVGFIILVAVIFVRPEGPVRQGAAQMTADAILTTEGLTKRFGGLIAVAGIDITLKRGTILGMIGINGAGKTTAMNCINGLYYSDGGKVFLNDQDITHRTPHEIARARRGAHLSGAAHLQPHEPDRQSPRHLARQFAVR